MSDPILAGALVLSCLSVGELRELADHYYPQPVESAFIVSAAPYHFTDISFQFRSSGMRCQDLDPCEEDRPTASPGTPRYYEQVEERARKCALKVQERERKEARSEMSPYSSLPETSTSTHSPTRRRC